MSVFADLLAADRYESKSLTLGNFVLISLLTSWLCQASVLWIAELVAKKSKLSIASKRERHILIIK